MTGYKTSIVGADTVFPFSSVSGNILYQKNNSVQIITDTITITESGKYIFLYSGTNNGITYYNNIKKFQLNGVDIAPLKDYVDQKDPSELYIFSAKFGDSLYYYYKNTGGAYHNYVYLIK